MGSWDQILVKLEHFFFFNATAMSLFYIIQRITFPQFCIFRKSITIHDPIASGVSVDPSSPVCSSAMLVLSIVLNLKVRFYVIPQWHNVHTNFHTNPSSGYRVESCGRTDRRTYIHDHPFRFNFMHIVQRTHKWR
jgi:hypothetical protein